MKAFFRDIFEYHNYFNQKLISIFMENAQNISQRTHPLFSHCLNAHQIWNSRILNKDSFGVHELHPLESFKEIDLQNFNTSLTIIETYDLDSSVTYQNSKGIAFQNTIRDVLFHISNHHTHHKGQLISDLRQQGIEPIATDYIFYKR